MTSINKLFEILPKKTKNKLYIFFLLLLIATLFELVSISALIPLVEVIVNGKTSFNFINNIIDFNSDNFTKKQILIILILQIHIQIMLMFLINMISIKLF